MSSLKIDKEMEVDDNKMGAEEEEDKNDNAGTSSSSGHHGGGGGSGSGSGGSGGGGNGNSGNMADNIDSAYGGSASQYHRSTDSSSKGRGSNLR